MKSVQRPDQILTITTFALIPGLGLRFQGASRWITLGPFSFQPTEMLKLTMILYLAAWLEGKKDLRRDLFEGFIPFLAILGIVGFLIIKQPDMGTLGIIVVISVIIFFLSGAKTAHIASMAGMG